MANCQLPKPKPEMNSRSVGHVTLGLPWSRDRKKLREIVVENYSLKDQIENLKAEVESERKRRAEAVGKRQHSEERGIDLYILKFLQY